jgi:hypothetical protein
MTVDTTAESNKRIEVLEAQRADDAATIKGLVKRAEAAEAEYAEISEEHTKRVEEIADLRGLAGRLAEAVRWWVKFTDRESFFPDDGEQWEALDQEIREALAAYREEE